MDIATWQQCKLYHFAGPCVVDSAYTFVNRINSGDETHFYC